NHRSPQLVQPRPSCLIAAQAKHSLQTQSASPVLLARHPPHRAEPLHHRLLGVLQNFPPGAQGLWSPILPFPGPRPKPPPLPAPPNETATPYHLHTADIEIPPASAAGIGSPTSLLATETRLQLAHISRVVVVHGSKLHRSYYMLGYLRQVKYPILDKSHGDAE